MKNLPRRWPREAGKKPTSREMNLVRQHQLAVTGSQNALVAAMVLRDGGATQPQIIAATGAPHRNKIKQLNAHPKVKLLMRQEGRIKVWEGRVH